VASALSASVSIRRILTSGNRKSAGYTFPLLSDPNAKVIRRYDVLHPGAGPKGTDIARPAEFLLDSNGIVRWVNLTENIAVRARPEQVLEALNQLSPAGQ
jgi:peroxiredoxin